MTPLWETVTRLLAPEHVPALLRFLHVVFILASLRVLWILVRTVAPPTQRPRRRENRGLRFVFVALAVSFTCLLLYQATWQLAGLARPRFVAFMQNYDRRSFNPARQLVRGRIVDRTGKVLAQNNPPESGTPRSYPLGPAAAHLVGYFHPVYGLSGIERAANRSLSGLELDSREAWETLGRNVIAGKRPPNGKDLALTIDASLQRYAYQLLGDWKGAVVVIEVRSGRVLTLCSRPSFDPNHLTPATFTKKNQAQLLNRAIHGRYPPGSVFKIAMAALALEFHIPQAIDCPDGFTPSANRKPIRDHVYYERLQAGQEWNGYGTIGLTNAFRISSNVYFAILATQLGRSGMAWIADKMGFHVSPILCDFNGSRIRADKSSLPRLPESDAYGLAQIGIGQGKLLMTPLHVAWICQAIGHKGVAMQPQVIEGAPPAVIGRFMSPGTAQSLLNLMRIVVTDGTAKALRNHPATPAGKTGTAQTPPARSHSWFAALAPYEDPQVAICVLVENGGYGSQTALPIAGKLLDKAMELGIIHRSP